MQEIQQAFMMTGKSLMAGGAAWIARTWFGGILSHEQRHRKQKNNIHRKRRFESRK